MTNKVNYKQKLERQTINTFSIEDLKASALQVNRHGTYFKYHVLSELLIRYLLSDFDRNFPLKQELENLCKYNGIDLERFKVEANLYISLGSEKKISRSSILSSIEELPSEKMAQVSSLDSFFVKRLNEEILSADGFIPVCADDENQSLLIPFRIEIGEEYGVKDQLGNNIPAWSLAVNSLTKILKNKFSIRILSKFDVLPIGKSLMLPVALSFFRKTNELPSYLLNRIFFTGEISDDGLLEPVKVALKSSYIKGMCPNALLVAPKCIDENISENNQQLYLINSGLSIQSIKEIIRELVEIKSPGLMRFTSADFERNKVLLQNFVSQRCVGNWGRVIQLLECYEKALDQDESPDSFALLHIVKGATYCHSGQTQKYNDCITFLRDFIKENNLPIDESDVLRMEIQTISNALDCEDFEGAKNIIECISSKILNNDDLQMRFHGSLYQYYRYLALLSSSEEFECYKKKSLENVRKAIQFAGKAGNENEIIQDYNYRHMWYATFEPGSEKEVEFFDKCINKLNGLDEEVKQKNIQFLMLQKWYSIYRQILLNKPPAIETDLDASAQFWLKALICKYKGAWYGVQNNLVKATELFNEALNELSNCNYEVLGYIKMTIQLEAYRTLKNLNDIENANKYLEEARSLVNLNINEFEKYSSFSFWKEYINNPDTAQFPGLKYWY